MLKAKKIETLENVLESLELVESWIQAKIQVGDFQALDADRIQGALEVLNHAAYRLETVVRSQQS